MWPQQNSKMSWPSSNSVFLSAGHWLQGENHSYWSGMLCLLGLVQMMGFVDWLTHWSSRYLQIAADINTLDQAVSYAALHSAISAGEALLKQNALLLPDVYDSSHEKKNYSIVLISEVLKLQIGFEANFHPCWNPTWLTDVVSRSMVKSCIAMVATLSMLLMCV